MHRLPLVCLLTVASFAADFRWQLPQGIPEPAVPSDNPMNPAKVELGRRLFYDVRMSVNQKQSCGSCHRQELAFTDGKPRAEGTTGAIHPRGSMSLVNVAYTPLLTWANPTVQTLEDQMLLPMFGTDPVELGMRGHEAEFLAILRRDAIYARLFPQAFPDQPDPYQMKYVIQAIAAFERTIISFRSPFDRNALSEPARRGSELFFGRLGCGNEQCHSDFTFTGAVRISGGQEPHVWYANTGLYTPAEIAEDPYRNVGLYEHTHGNGDIGRFRAPTLRNIAITAPYMHDGSIATLEQVIDHYGAGGRSKTPRKSPLVRPFQISAEEKQAIIEFLKSLTDEELLRDPRWSDPWKPPPVSR